MTAGAEAEFDLLLSFAGSERDFARAIHDITAANGLRVFLDEEFQHEVWGQNLVEYLDRTYRERGKYVLALISKDYRERAYTRVERRAALDRMIQTAGEYLLPVKVDDSWIDGLPTSTAHLDLRIHGVLGVCELLVRKLRGPAVKLVVPPGVAVPRVPLGCLAGDLLSRYLLELCDRPQRAAFGALVYDESCAPLRDLLRVRNYWDGLDKASGPHFEIFALRDTEAYGLDGNIETKLDFVTAASLNRSLSRGYYFSQILKNYFGEPKTRLQYPAFLIFITENRKIHACRLIPLENQPADKMFVQLLGLFTAIAAAIEEAGGPPAAATVVWDHIRRKLQDFGHTIYIQRPPADVGAAVRGLTKYVEN